MARWKYCTFAIHYEKKLKNWAVEYANKPPLVGLQAILEAYGSGNWSTCSQNDPRPILDLGRGTSSQRLYGRRSSGLRRNDQPG